MIPTSGFFFLMIQLPTRPTLFPYTTLFRSGFNGPRPSPARDGGELLRASATAPAPGADAGQERRGCGRQHRLGGGPDQDRKSTRLNSSHRTISYAVLCLKKKIRTDT